MKASVAPGQIDLTKKNSVPGDGRYDHWRRPADPPRDSREFLPRRSAEPWRAENRDVGKIVHRTKVQPQPVDLPFRPAESGRQESRPLFGGGYTPKFQLMSNLNVPPSRHEIPSRVNPNMPAALAPTSNRGLTAEPPIARSIHSSANSHRRQVGARTLSGGERSGHLRSPVDDPLFKHRIYAGHNQPSIESAALPSSH